MNTLLSWIRHSLFLKAIMEYLILLKIKSGARFKYSQDISLHISMWRLVRRDVPMIWVISKSQLLFRFAVQTTLKDNLVDSFYQMKYIIIPLFFTYIMGSNMLLAYYQEHYKQVMIDYEQW